MRLLASSTVAASVLCLSLLSGTARAQVTYIFDGASGSGTETFAQSFTLEVPDYITSDTTFDVADLSACAVVIGPCVHVGFRMHDINSPELGAIDFKAGNATTHYYFEGHAFQTPGQHRMVSSGLFNPAVLTVVGPPVPEPATALLLGAGLACLPFAARRQRRLSVALPGRQAR